MLKYVLSRLGQTIIVFILVTLFTFLMLNVIPGDPVLNMLQKRADEATIARVREQLGLDKPLPTQYLNFVKGAVKGDLGNSYFQKSPVIDMVTDGLRVTLKIGLVSLVAALGVGLIIGSLAAVFRGSWVDRVLMFIATIGISAPIFWIAVILQIVLGLKLGLFPISGQSASGWMVMPVICLALNYGASSARLIRTNMIEALTQDYVRTARSKGIGEFVVVFKHVLKNAGISIITLTGMQLRSLLSGTMVLEIVFSLRGLGKVSYDAIVARDIPLIQGCVLYTAIVYVFINLIVDLLYGVLDPRVRLA